jgi:hypothetical protein
LDLGARRTVGIGVELRWLLDPVGDPVTFIERAFASYRATPSVGKHATSAMH